jgi:hypothetical protein
MNFVRLSDAKSKKIGLYFCEQPARRRSPAIKPILAEMHEACILLLNST